MIAINLSNISLILGSHKIFGNLNWRIKNTQKIGLIGPNGAGKSSLLKIITGEFSPEPGGTVTSAKGITIGYLPQEPDIPAGLTAFETTLASNTRWYHLKVNLKELENNLDDPDIYNNPKSLTRTLDAQEKCLEEYLALGGDRYPERVHQVLTGLGLKEKEHDKPISVLSGGQKKLVGLAGILLARPAVLLLDEPDNHLDLEGKVYLENLIRDYPGAVVIISHDRYLLDAAVTQITEIEEGCLSNFTGDYSSYVVEKEVRLARQEDLYRVQQHQIHRMETAIKRYALWGKVYDNEKFAVKARSMQKRLDRMEKIDRPITERRRMNLELNGWRGSDKVLEICDLEKSFSGHPIFLGLNTLIQHGEKIGLIGPNGAGKSLLMRIIRGEEPADQGEIHLGPSVISGYYAQEQETLNKNMTLMETVRRSVPAGRPMSESNAVAFLNRYVDSTHKCNSEG